jgi:hypothetical protein
MEEAVTPYGIAWSSQVNQKADLMTSSFWKKAKQSMWTINAAETTKIWIEPHDTNFIGRFMIKVANYFCDICFVS